MNRITTVLFSTVALGMAGAASAQVLGGQVGAGAGLGVQTPQAGPLVGSVVRGAGETTRDTLRDSRDFVRDTRPQVGVRGDADVRSDTRLSRNQTDVSAALRTGAEVRASDGRLVGSVVDVTRNAAGRATDFTLRTADGATRTIRATSVGVQGDALVTVGNW